MLLITVNLTVDMLIIFNINNKEFFTICFNLKWIFSKFIIGQAVRVFAIGPGDQGSIPGQVIPKTQKMVLDASFLNTQHY